jgi:hypothetical protein
MLLGGVVAVPFTIGDYWFNNSFEKDLLFALSVTLFGLINILWLTKSVLTNKILYRQRIIQFSLARMLIATSVVALVFGAPKIWCNYNYKDWGGVFGLSIIAIALGSLTLVCSKSDSKHIIFPICLFMIMVIIVAIARLFIRW